ncbi:MAG: helix-hairpin-helix domain-containing protein [Bacteroidota bacterium]
MAKAQEEITIKDLIGDIVEDLPEDLDLSEITERLLFFKKHPINLNKADSEILKSLYFISPLQISNLLAYRNTNGKLIAVLELQAIPSFDSATIQKLLPFVTINESDLQEKVTFKKLIKIGENDLVMRLSSTLEPQKGFKNLPGNTYQGSPEKFLFRYKYNFSNRITASLVMEKDAGEKLVSRPLDFISSNITLTNLGSFKKIIIGDYSLQFGQGIALWTGFGYGKGADVTSIAKKDVGLKPYSSANEYAFFRGLASTIRLSKHLAVSPFISYRKHDAATKNKQLTTINETGYHRTLTEIANANSLTQQVYGTAIQYQKNTLTIGATAYLVHHNLTFIKGPAIYQSYNLSGKNLANLGFYYSYTYKNMYLFGEVAKSLKDGAAYVNGLLISFSNQVSAAILQRNYQRDYHSFFNQATAEAEGFNEQGLYAGLNIMPFQKWTISLYADYFRFPWLKFSVDAPSKGDELLAQLTYTPSKTFKATVRYKSELKQQNTDLIAPINFLDEIKKESYRVDISWRLNKTFTFQNKVEVAQYKKGVSSPEFGYLVGQDFSYAPNNSRFSGNLRLAYFNTHSYNSRLYAYEDDVLYNFSFGIYSGKGLRTYANVKYKLTKKVEIWFRYALYYYPNAAVIGTGLDEINGDQKSEAKVQFRYQF